MRTNLFSSKKFWSIFLVFVMVLGVMPTNIFTASAAEEYVYQGGAGIRIADLDTSKTYTQSLGDNASTEYSGRIWTDKSVYTTDAIFDLFGGGTHTIKINESTKGEDFLVA